MPIYCEQKRLSFLPMTDTHEKIRSSYYHINQAKNCYVFDDFGAVLEDDKHIFLVLVIWFFFLLAKRLSLPQQLIRLIGLGVQSQLEKIQIITARFTIFKHRFNSKPLAIESRNFSKSPNYGVYRMRYTCLFN